MYYRSCYQLDQIYLLVREKKGKSTQERFEDIFSSIVSQFYVEIFDKLKQEQPGFLSKVTIICGDCSKKKLGISDENLKLLQTNVNVIFHTAAIVNFEASLAQAVLSNVCATKEFLELATSFGELETFVFVSTAYSNGYKADVDEKVNPTPIGPHEVIHLCETMSEAKLAEIVPSLMEGWPNTYTFSKCLTENLILQYKDKFPIAIVRPSQVTSIAFEPTPGWIGNYYGPTGILTAAGIGLMRTFMMDRRLVLDIIPCDMAINLLITIPWSWNRNALRRSVEDLTFQQENGTTDQGVMVYNFVSGKRNPIKYEDFLKKSIRYLYKDPPENCLWSLIFITTTSLRLYKLLHILLHIMPGHIIDNYLRLAGQKPRMIKIYNKMEKLTLLLKSFTMCQWNFDDTNVQRLWQQLEAKDQKLFPFNVKDLDWDDYVENNARGIRLYVLQDKNEHRQFAKRRYLMLRAANAMLWTSLTTMLVYGLSNLMPKSKL
ncbi:hypothetical protein M8J77_012388 [Diaphorina citri]|nr:hypothetical protein M8J77_012388 [Diaphorina citri]